MPINWLACLCVGIARISSCQASGIEHCFRFLTPFSLYLALSHVTFWDDHYQFPCYFLKDIACNVAVLGPKPVRMQPHHTPADRHVGWVVVCTSVSNVHKLFSMEPADVGV